LQRINIRISLFFLLLTNLWNFNQRVDSNPKFSKKFSTWTFLLSPITIWFVRLFELWQSHGLIICFNGTFASIFHTPQPFSQITVIFLNQRDSFILQCVSFLPNWDNFSIERKTSIQNGIFTIFLIRVETLTINLINRVTNLRNHPFSWSNGPLTKSRTSTLQIWTSFPRNKSWKHN